MKLAIVGGVIGLAWAASLRGYMVELAGGASRVDWVGTFVLILLPGVVIGVLLGLAEHFRRTGGRRGWRWLAAAPVLFAVAALSAPGALLTFVTTGIGGGAIAVVAAGMLGGYAISGRGPLVARIACGTIALAPIGLTALSGLFFGPSLALSTARGLWVALLGSSLLVVLALACSIPHRRVVSIDT